MTRTQILKELQIVNSAIARARENLTSSSDSVASSAGMRLYALNAEKRPRKIFRTIKKLNNYLI